jgi:acetyltransferase-like isoleucine patch superfamily enzyme
MRIRNVINKTISAWKGHPYEVDPAIPMSYLFSLVVSRAWMLLRGMLSGIDNEGLFFLAGKTKIKARSKMKIGRSNTIARNCYIDALSVNGIRFGDNVSVGMNTVIECTGNLQFLGKGLKVGNSVGLGSNNFYGCAGGIQIGDDTIIGNYVSFHSENHVYDNPIIPIRLQGVKHAGIRVGNNCWIGAKATILDGAHISDGCVIAAGAVVAAGHYSENGIYGGVPARFLKWRAEELINV